MAAPQTLGKGARNTMKREVVLLLDAETARGLGLIGGGTSLGPVDGRGPFRVSYGGAGHLLGNCE